MGCCPSSKLGRCCCFTWVLLLVFIAVVVLLLVIYPPDINPETTVQLDITRVQIQSRSIDIALIINVTLFNTNPVSANRL